MVVLIWGGSYPAIKATQPFFPPVAFATFRCAVAAAILVLVGLATGALRASLAPRDWGVVVLLGLFGNTLFHSLLVLGGPSHLARPRRHPGRAEPGAGGAPGPPPLRGAGRRAPHGRASRSASSGVGADRAARQPRARPPLLGDLLSLGASLSWALYTVVGKPLLARATPLAVTTWATLIGVIPLLPFGVPGLREVRWAALTPGEWLLLAYLSAGTIALANLLWYVALARTATARVVAFSFLIPLIATMIAVLAGQETLTPSLALGAAAVLGGVALAHRA